VNLDEAHRASQLTPRERKILELLSRGDSIQEIATYTQLDDQDDLTVRIHVRHIIEKLQLRIHIQTERIRQKELQRAKARERRAR
jgi:DNA-binding NarL/FixJ family response regulator